MIKSILISKHITMLSSGGSLDRFYYVINSKYRAALEVILKQNIKNEQSQKGVRLYIIIIKKKKCNLKFYYY